MLIRGESECALMYLCDLAEARLEVLVRFVLYATIFYESHKIVLPILADSPSEVVYVAIEFVVTSRCNLVSEKLLYGSLEVI